VNRGFSCVSEQPKLYVHSRRQRLIAVKALTACLTRIRDAEYRHLDLKLRSDAMSGRRYEAELIISIIDDAIYILEALH